MSEPTNDLAAEAGRFSEITILPDGRVYVFGICREVLDLVNNVSSRGTGLHRAVDDARTAEKEQKQEE
jgi:hypothetical protein